MVGESVPFLLLSTRSMSHATSTCSAANRAGRSSGVSSSMCLWWISSPILSETIPSWAIRWSSAAMRSSSSCDSPGRAWPRAPAILPEACSFSRPRYSSMSCSKVSCSGFGLSSTRAPLFCARCPQIMGYSPMLVEGKSSEVGLPFLGFSANFALRGFSEVRVHARLPAW